MSLFLPYNNIIMNDITQGLNEQQKQAVEHLRGDLLVLAGAGSGKTRVLTARIANLVRHGASPYEILAVTFTNKAASEMKERLGKILGEETVKKMWVGTFHSICGRILRTDIDKYKNKEGKSLNKNFVIYGDDETSTLIKDAVKKFNLDDKIYAPKLIKTIISNAKNKMQDAYTFSTRARDYKSEKIAQVYTEYEKQLILNNAMDFDDMLMLTVNLLTTVSEIREKYAQRFKHILVDEFQDTNQAQYDLIKMLYSKKEDSSLCVVGDVDQSIYSWRGADFRIILNFQNDFRGSKMIKLEKNYRSTDCILKAANEIIKNNTQRIERNLYSQKGKGEKIKGYEAYDESSEADYIARTIINKGYKYEDCAVLYRTNAQSRSLEEACMARGLPYKIIGGLRFYERKEIKDIVAYLKLIFNPNDSQSLKRIINIPKRNIGATTLKKLFDLSNELNMSVFEIIQEIDKCGENISAKTKNALSDFKDTIIKLTNVQSVMSLGEFVAHILEFTGYLAMLEAEDSEEAHNRIENLQEFINAARDFESGEEENTLSDFLSQIALVSDVDQIEDGRHLTLMTLHCAKGLEFPIVFLCGLEEGIFPHSRTFNAPSELEEERRLMYVGVTRAQEQLFITWAKRRQMWGEYKNFAPSRFLSEIPQDVFEANTSDIKAEKTFKSAVEKIKSTGSFGKDFKPQAKGLGQVSRPLGNSFGKNFKPPSKSLSRVVKKEDSRIREEKERAKVQDLIAACKNTAQKSISRGSFAAFKIGDRVFHEKFGIGHLLGVEDDGISIFYTINFGKTIGVKALDAQFSRLKKI